MAIMKRVVITALVLGWVAIGFSADYFVATNGSDLANGSSVRQAWGSIQHALDSVGAGDTVFVRGGVYSERLRFGASGSDTGGELRVVAYPGEQPVIDGRGLVVSNGIDALLEIDGQHDITVSGFELRNFSTSLEDHVPAGLYVHGAARNIRLENLDVHHIATNYDPGGDDARGGDAHGLVVYGDSAIGSVSGITISRVRVHDCTLGSSEALVLNGNVDGFAVKECRVYDNNNIGIVFIGHEGVCSDPARDQARNGTCTDCEVWNISSRGNPAYRSGNGYDRSADGIYVDGGTRIVIERNKIRECDICLEVASEHGGKSASLITVRNNLLVNGYSGGLYLGGYDRQRGSTVDCKFIGNTFYHNNTARDYSGEITVQYFVTNCVFRNNLLVALKNEGGDAVYFGGPGGCESLPVNITVDCNLYISDETESPCWRWGNSEYYSFKDWQALGHDTHGVYASDPLFAGAGSGDLSILPNSPAEAVRGGSCLRVNALRQSPGNRMYFVAPVWGSDSNNGASAKSAWKTFAPLNRLRLAAGDRVEIFPGRHRCSLKPSGGGSAEKPVVISFLPGRHEFAADAAVRRAYYISNSSDAPTVPRAVGILLESCHNMTLQGEGGVGSVRLVYMGRMTEFVNDRCYDISYEGLSFDLARPTVSEFRVLKVAGNTVEIRVAEGSSYKVEGGKFSWTGDLGGGGLMTQVADVKARCCHRLGGVNPFAGATAAELGDRRVRLTYSGKLPKGMAAGVQYQMRHTRREVVGALNARCRKLSFCDCRFYALTGMGVVSQYCEDLSFIRSNVEPPPETIRTCPAWADCFHFSGCRGQVLVDSCRFSGAQDDAVNVHGTHLGIVGKVGDNQLKLRFMQRQTYGIQAFVPGDEVAVIDHKTLLEIPGNPRRRVTAVERIGDGREWLLTLDGPVPQFGQNDVIDNLSWYPDVTIRNCYADMIPARGFLLTTRGKVLVENCTFFRCHMPGVLVEDDASGWFESGPVRDMTIFGNRFVGCGIRISPHTGGPSKLPVHENIRIVQNCFAEGAGINACNVRDLEIIGNRFSSRKLPVSTLNCEGVQVEENKCGGVE